MGIEHIIYETPFTRMTFKEENTDGSDVSAVNIDDMKAEYQRYIKTFNMLVNNTDDVEECMKIIDIQNAILRRGQDEQDELTNFSNFLKDEFDARILRTTKYPITKRFTLEYTLDYTNLPPI
jgi:uncharacterized protein YaaN involved in tellurite resistance